jgi:hypothetical protein
VKILRSKHLEAAIDEMSLTVEVLDRRSGTRWRMQEDGPGDIGLRGHCGPWQGMAFRSARERKWECGESEAQVTLFGWPYSANVWSPAALGVTVRFRLGDDSLEVAPEPYRPEYGEISLIDSYYPRGFLFPENVGGKLVLPFGQGCLLDKHYPHELDMVQPGWVGIAFVMPWWGQIAENGAGLIALTTTPDDLAFRLKTEGRQGVTVHPYWQASLGGLKYTRSLTYQFFEKTDVLSLAKRYRRHAETLMEVKPLKERARERPNVECLRGGMQAAVWAMSTFRDRVLYGDFDECFRRYRRVTEGAGVRKAVCHLDGWGKDGYDYNHPDVLPPDERLGGWEGLRRMAERVRGLGHGFLLHDNYVDYYAHTEAFRNGDGVLDLSGMHSESTEWLGGRQQWLCSTQAMKYARRNLTGLERRVGLQGIYVDCWTIGHLRECFDQRHPATRAATRQAWSEVFAMCQKMGWLTSCEGGNDWAVPTVDFCHTVQPDVIPHVLRGTVASFGTSIPLYAMVWHDCMVVPGWIDMQKSPANIREGCVVEEKRDMRLWTLLWCGIPSFRTPSCDVACDAPDPGDVSDEIAFVRQLDVIARFHAIAGFDPMTHWESTPDGLVQTAVYGDDGSVTVDFRRNHYRLSASGLKEEGMAE